MDPRNGKKERENIENEYGNRGQTIIINFFFEFINRMKKFYLAPFHTKKIKQNQSE